jgi:general secretion pathway protein G
MMLVLLIMGALVSIVAINFVGQNKTAKIQTTTITMQQIESSLKSYNIATGAFPTTAEGLNVLVPNYMEKIKPDAWKVPFQYFSPTTDPNAPFEIISAGPDKQFGTADDISSRTLE